MRDNEIYYCKGCKGAHNEIHCRGLRTHVRARRLTDRQIKVDKKTSPMLKPPVLNKQRSDNTRRHSSALVILTLSLIERCVVT